MRKPPIPSQVDLTKSKAVQSPKGKSGSTVKSRKLNKFPLLKRESRRIANAFVVSAGGLIIALIGLGTQRGKELILGCGGIPRPSGDSTQAATDVKALSPAKSPTVENGGSENPQSPASKTKKQQIKGESPSPKSNVGPSESNHGRPQPETKPASNGNGGTSDPGPDGTKPEEHSSTRQAANSSTVGATAPSTSRYDLVLLTLQNDTISDNDLNGYYLNCIENIGPLQTRKDRETALMNYLREDKNHAKCLRH